LSELSGVRVLSPAAPEGTGIVTLVARHVDPAGLARRLEADFGVQGRAGLHCAPGTHRLLGTTATGALRLSLGWSSTIEDVDRALAGLAVLAAPPTVRVP
jgi:selenocysteine lyase/cysteine desulfurase